MAITPQSTSNITKTAGVNVLIYGQSGMGKTELIGTAPKPVIISVENGLRTLKGKNIPYLQIETYAQFIEAYNMVAGPYGNQFDTICLDSLTEIAEIMIRDKKRTVNDARLAYDAVDEDVYDMIRKFRRFRQNVYMIAKEGSRKVDGSTIATPDMPSWKMGNNLPYEFDLVLRAEKMEYEGKTYHVLRTKGTNGITAKQRGNELDEFEAPDLTALFRKIA